MLDVRMLKSQFCFVLCASKSGQKVANRVREYKLAKCMSFVVVSLCFSCGLLGLRECVFFFNVKPRSNLDCFPILDRHGGPRIQRLRQEDDRLHRRVFGKHSRQVNHTTAAEKMIHEKKLSALVS